jgi:hypothetical protein
VREKLEQHRADPACAACHKLMDPIGFALDFDWMGRWREKVEFLRNLAGKIFGYALGRGLQDGDGCTLQHLVDTMAKDGYRARTLVREIVLSVPFRNSQAGVTVSEAAPAAPKVQRPMVIK